MEQNIRLYSALVIVNTAKGASEEEAKAIVKSIIGENSGEIVKENVMGKRMLAYPIKKQQEGFYYEIFFNAKPEAIIKIDRQFQINTNILRSIISKEKKAI